MLLGQALFKLNHNSHSAKSHSKSISIRVRMKGESPEAHAEAILDYFGYNPSNEDTFKVKYGYDLRKSFVDGYSRKDTRSAHKAVGKGYFEVTIPLSKTLFAQIKSIKNPISSNLPNGGGNANVSESEVRRPTVVPKNAAPAVQGFYRELDLFKTEAMNFGSRLVQDAAVRADYIKTIQLASDEFIELVESGQIPYEEGARRANLLRNYILQTSRGKNSEFGRAIAEFLKKEGPTLEQSIAKRAGTRFPGRLLAALTQEEKDLVYLDVIIGAGGNRKTVSGIAPYLGKFGKVCLVASIAISVYNVATAEDKVNAAGREGSSILGGMAGGAAGGALAGLMCGPGAPLCSGIGIFVGGAVGAFVASGGYDWLTSK